MTRLLSEKLAKAEQLLEEVNSWTEEEIKELPKFYRDKAREYRGLTNSGDG